MKFLTSAIVVSILSVIHIGAQPIFDYVATPDDAFAWNVPEMQPPSGGSATIHLQMTSQSWKGIEWQHRIAIAKPEQMKHPDHCVLFITGGNPAGEEFMLAKLIAAQVGLPLAVLGDIPNQPLFDGLTEDGLISYTFSKYLETEDPTWPLLFPMTKAAVRAMDAIQELSSQQWAEPIKKFIVTGASKRGWTTWFTGEVDDRVAAIIPLVYDNLNLTAQMQHHIDQWGRYSEQINDYTERGLPQLLRSGEGQKLASMVDPYTYRDRARMPKLIVTGTNDPYWPLDAANDYFQDLSGPKYILYVPNSGHGLDDRMRALAGLRGFSAAIAAKAQLPNMQWEFEAADDGMTLIATTDIAPERVLLWRATSQDKDFRDAEWTSEELQPDDAQYRHTEPEPEDGYVSWFFEFNFRIAGEPLPLSTQLRIIGG